VPVGIAVVAVVAFLVTDPVFKRYRLPSASMAPTLALGTKVNVDEGAYGDKGPAIGDIVLFNPPSSIRTADDECAVRHPEDQACPRPSADSAGVLFIKRVVAGPGDVVAVRSSHVYRNGEEADEPFIHACGGPAGCDFPRKLTVPDGMYFLLGDNRGESDDSRFFGPVRREWIRGQVMRCDALYFACSPAG
jgi:signal peptidase I